MVGFVPTFHRLMTDPRLPLAVSYWPADKSEPLLERTVGDALRDAAARWAERVALVDGSPATAARRRWTFSALLSDAEAVARALLGRFRPGDHVAVWAANSPEWVLLEFGAALAGLTLVTVNPAYLAKELGYVLRQSRAVGLFVMPVYRERSLVEVQSQTRGMHPSRRVRSHHAGAAHGGLRAGDVRCAADGARTFCRADSIPA
jgi:fatty-acyl-CoA synthase